MSSSDARRKNRIFIASAELDLGEVRAAIQQLDLDAVTLEQVAAPGGKSNIKTSITVRHAANRPVPADRRSRPPRERLPRSWLSAAQRAIGVSPRQSCRGREPDRGYLDRFLRGELCRGARLRGVTARVSLGRAGDRDGGLRRGGALCAHALSWLAGSE
jgi:hypothetical protein